MADEPIQLPVKLVKAPTKSHLKKHGKKYIGGGVGLAGVITLLSTLWPVVCPTLPVSFKLNCENVQKVIQASDVLIQGSDKDVPDVK